MNKLKTTPTKEFMMESEDTIVSVYGWGNGEGYTIAMDHKRASLIAASLTYEEIDLLVAALTGARAAGI